MSYITPKLYSQIAETLATSYVNVRNTLYANGGASGAYADALDIVSDVVQATDDNSDETASIVHSLTRDPMGSISSDLGATMKAFGIKFTYAESKKLAAAYFTGILKSLNTHVVARTPLPPTGNMRNINEYYAAYDDDPRASAADDEMSLFTWQTGQDTVSDSSYYFSDDFVELSSEAGVTINEIFTTAFYVYE